MSLDESTVRRALDAWDRGDAPASEDVGAALSREVIVALDLRINAFKKTVRRPLLDPRRTVVEALVAAATSPAGIGTASLGAGTRAIVALAVRRGDEVFLDVGLSKSTRLPSGAWPELGPWRRALPENVVQSHAWCEGAGRVRLAATASVLTPPQPADDVSLLERAACEEPDDDELRAVLGDALSARGDARGELIALQLARAPFLVPSAAQATLLAREAKLLPAVTRAAATTSLSYARSTVHRRGLVEGITVSGNVFQKRGAAMIEEAPILRLVLSPNTPSTLAALLATPALSGVRELDLSDRASSSADVSALIASPHVARVRVLDWGLNSSLRPADLERLASAPFAANLLGLRAGLDDEAVQWLADHDEALPSLTRLAVGEARQGLLRLCAQRPLEMLSMERRFFSADELFEHRRSERLVWLSVGTSEQRSIGPVAELQRLASAPPALRCLALSSHPRFTVEELARVCTSRVFEALRYLHCTMELTPLDEEAAARLLSHPSLQHVSLHDVDVSMLSRGTRERLALELGPIEKHYVLATAFQEAFWAAPAVVQAAASMRDAPHIGAVVVVDAGETPAVRTKLEIATDPTASAEELAGLAVDASPEVFEALTRNPATRSDVIDSLVASKRASTTQLKNLASNPNASADRLAELGRSKHKTVMNAVASNPSAREDTLRALFAAGADASAFVRNPSTPPELLVVIAQKHDEAAVLLASRSELPAQVRAELATSANHRVVLALLQRDDLTPEDVMLAVDKTVAHPEILALALRNTAPRATSRATRERALELAEQTPHEWQARSLLSALASNPNTEADLVEAVAAMKMLGSGRSWLNDDDILASLVARHPNAALERIETLASFRPLDVAMNPSAPALLLVALAKRGAQAEAIVVENPSCPSLLVREALTSRFGEVRSGAARNPTLDREHLEELARSTDEYTCAGVAGNARTSPALLERLARGDSPRVWLAVAKNPRAPRAVLESIADRGGFGVEALGQVLTRRGVRPPR